MLDFLCEACRVHFGSVEKWVQRCGLRYALNPRMVRGLDYYCRTTFEWTSSHLGAQNTVAAGGRYDGLVEDLGGPPVAGVGFALGVERLVLLIGMRESKLSPRTLLYVAWMGEPAQDWAFPLVHRLRLRGVTVEMEGGGEEPEEPDAKSG